jgi:hypothetical protein
VAVNLCEAFTPKRTEEGETEIPIDGGTMVTVAKADLDGSDIEIAISVTVGFVGTVVGAV